MGIAYNMSGGIRFNLAINLTGLDLRCNDLYANMIDMIYVPFGECDIVISPSDTIGSYIMSSYNVINYINI